MTTKKLDIKINQSIITILGKKLYQSSFGTVVLRELIQNSLDANSAEIRVDYDPSERILIVTDNGCGIEKIEGLLDTIGESVKDITNLDTIGGYGLAKLAIFGCKVWEFKSISGSFSTGFLCNLENKTLSGTTVLCQFEDADLSWNYESKIESYLKSIQRNVTFFFNNLPVEKPELSSCFFGVRYEVLASTGDNGNVVVRVNGLPTFRRYVRNLEKTIYMDYEVRCSPYDEKYPLTSNRDTFIDGTVESDDLKSRIDAIERKLETDKALEQNKKLEKSELTWRNKKYLGGNGVTIQDFIDHSVTITTFERYINQISDVLGYGKLDCIFGLWGDNTECEASYNPSEISFMIFKNISGKGHILALAIHEFTHYMGYGQCGHDQEYSSHLTDVTGTIMSAIFSGDFRK